MDLNPTRSTGYILAMILSPPPLHKAHSHGTHLSEAVHRLKALVHVLSQKLGKLLIVEDL